MFSHDKARQDEPVRYISKMESSALSLEVAFFGGAEKAGSLDPKKTKVVARCLRKANIWRESPWIEAWTRSFGDVLMPDGAWNGVQLVDILASRGFLGISNNLIEVDIEQGHPKWSVVTGNTPIYHVMSSLDGRHLRKV